MLTSNDLWNLSVDWFEAAGVTQDKYASLELSWHYLILYTFLKP